jgi:hypothetical protein
MARTLIPAASIITPIGPNQGTASIAGLLDIVWQASDVANGNYFTPSPGDFLLIQNTAGVSGTFTLTSAPDASKRLNDITTYTLATLKTACFHYGDLNGWRQTDGTIYVNGSAATILFAVLHDPG